MIFVFHMKASCMHVSAKAPEHHRNLCLCNFFLQAMLKSRGTGWIKVITGCRWSNHECNGFIIYSTVHNKFHVEIINFNFKWEKQSHKILEPMLGRPSIWESILESNVEFIEPSITNDEPLLSQENSRFHMEGHPNIGSRMLC